MTPRQEQIQKWEDTINNVVTHYQRLNAACGAAIKAGCLDIEGTLHDAIWGAFDAMLNECDSDVWIAWFVFDNKCGKNKFTVRDSSGKIRKITKASQLAKLIVDEQNTP